MLALALGCPAPLACRVQHCRAPIPLAPQRSHAAHVQVGPLYLAAMDAIHSVAPNMLMAIEGTGQLGIPGINWGDGFATDPDVLRVSPATELS